VVWQPDGLIGRFLREMLANMDPTIPHNQGPRLNHFGRSAIQLGSSPGGIGLQNHKSNPEDMTGSPKRFRQKNVRKKNIIKDQSNKFSYGYGSKLVPYHKIAS